MCADDLSLSEIVSGYPILSQNPIQPGRSILSKDPIGAAGLVRSQMRRGSSRRAAVGA